MSNENSSPPQAPNRTPQSGAAALDASKNKITCTTCKVVSPDESQATLDGWYQAPDKSWVCHEHALHNFRS